MTNSQTHKHSGLAKQRAPSVTNKDTHKLAGLARHTVTSVTKSVKALTLSFSYSSLRKTEKPFIKSALNKASGLTDILMKIVHTAFIIPQITDKISCIPLKGSFYQNKAGIIDGCTCKHCTALYLANQIMNIKICGWKA